MNLLINYRDVILKNADVEREKQNYYSVGSVYGVVYITGFALSGTVTAVFVIDCLLQTFQRNV